MDVVIIGAGIIGCGIARELSKYENLKITVVEKEADASFGTSKANTALIHACYDDDSERYPLRAQLCPRGNRMWRRWIRELDIPSSFPGSLVLAKNNEEIKILDELKKRGERNGVTSLRILYGNELRNLEENLNDDTVAGLYAPTAGKISPYEATFALMENARDNGAKFVFRKRVVGIKIKGGEVRGVELSDGSEINSEIIINASGIYADKISRMAGIDKFKITPRKGEYMLFDKDAYPKVSLTLFPTPTPKTKGVVVTTTVEGNLMLGPNAQDVEDRDDLSNTKEGLSFVWDSAKKIVKKLPPKDRVIRTFAGMRAEPTGGDFIIENYDEPWGFINVAGIRSPGLTSAPAIAEKVGEIIGGMGVNLKRKEKWNPMRKGIKRIAKMSDEERERRIRENPLYGKIVCMCEMVSEYEILEAIRRGATTLDGIKLRTRAMMGRCQGNFCRLKIAMILARELGINLWEVELKGEDSEIGIGDVKTLQRGESK